MIIFAVCYFFALFFKIIVVGEEDFIGHITLTECGETGGYFNACYNVW